MTARHPPFDVRLDRVTTEVCRALLRPGQAKRLPLDPARAAFGWLIVCPCGRANFLTRVNADDFEESAGQLTGARFTCDGCGRPVVVAGDEVTCC